MTFLDVVRMQALEAKPDIYIYIYLHRYTAIYNHVLLFRDIFEKGT